MRRFEGCLLSANLLATLAAIFWQPSWLPWRFMLPMLAFACFWVHVFVEQHRWQMIPAYIWTGIVCLLALMSIVNLTALAQVIFLLVIFPLFVISTALPAIFPIFQLPKPPGSYPIGTTLFTVLHNENEIVVQSWYPAQAGSGQLAPYLADAPFPWDWLRLVVTHALTNAPPFDEDVAYPVIFFGHGGGFMAVQNIDQMQALASHGYVVFSISHVQDSAVVIYPDGRNNGRSLWRAWKEMKPVLADNNAASALIAALRNERGKATLPIAEKQAVMQTIFVKHKVARDVVERRAEEVTAVIDYLSQKSPTHLPFAGRLDMNRIGIYGHSNGGAVAVNVAMRHSRIKAVANLDGYLFGDVFRTGLSQPFMSIHKERSYGCDDVVYAQAHSAAYSVTVQGTNHFNFMDMYLWMPFFNNRILGPIDPARAAEIINHFLLAFFDKHLNQEHPPLLNSPLTPYPEVDFKMRNS